MMSNSSPHCQESNSGYSILNARISLLYDEKSPQILPKFPEKNIESMTLVFSVAATKCFFLMTATATVL